MVHHRSVFKADLVHCYPQSFKTIGETSMPPPSFINSPATMSLSFPQILGKFLSLIRNWTTTQNQSSRDNVQHERQ